MAGEFGPDGTQALPPLPVYPDALGGLPAASFTDPATWSEAFADAPDTTVPPPAPLVRVDPEQVRAAAQRELARDRARRAARPAPPAPLPPAPGLQYTRSAPTIGLPAAGGLPPAAAAQQVQRKNNAAGCVGCAVVLVFVFIVLAAVFVAVGSHQ
jgi:hypothetical protein